VSRRRPILDQPPKPIAQRADSEQIVQAVIGAAIELGPHATLAAIAAKAGVGPASLHRYFPNTAAIFAEVSRQTYRTLLDQMRELITRTDLDLHEMLAEVCRAAVAGPGLSMEHRRRLNLEIPLVWSMGTAEPVYAEVLELGSKWIRSHVEHPPDDLDARLFAAFGMIRGTMLLTMTFPNLAPPLDVLVSTLTESVYRTIATPSSVPTRP